MEDKQTNHTGIYLDNFILKSLSGWYLMTTTVLLMVRIYELVSITRRVLVMIMNSLGFQFRFSKLSSHSETDSNSFRINLPVSGPGNSLKTLNSISSRIQSLQENKTR